MNWSWGASPALVCGGLLVVALAGAIGYLNWTRGGRRRIGGLLELLRFLLVLLLGFTLLRPEVVQSIRSRERPQLTILVDQSGSMATRDLLSGGPLESREEWVARRLQQQFWGPLTGKVNVAIEEFGRPATNAPLSARGTDLNTALERPLDEAGNLQAVLLLSDGDWNSGQSPLAAAARYREREIPVFAVTVGSETPLPDLHLETVSPPSYGLFGEQITIPFTIRSHLTNEVKTTIVLQDGSKEETRKEIVIPAQGQMQDTILWYPRNVGEVDLTLKLPVQPGETFPDNNEKRFQISVRVEKIQVLVVDSLPRWEYRYLRNALARDPGVEVHSLLFHPGMKPGGGRNYLPAFPSTRDAISRYDVIFLGDVGLGEGELNEADTEMIRGLVEQQSSGVVFLPGRRGRQASLANSALKELIPVVLDSSPPMCCAHSAKDRRRPHSRVMS